MYKKNPQSMKVALRLCKRVQRVHRYSIKMSSAWKYNAKQNEVQNSKPQRSPIVIANLGQLQCDSPKLC
jgi:hypothetical protein